MTERDPTPPTQRYIADRARLLANAVEQGRWLGRAVGSHGGAFSLPIESEDGMSFVPIDPCKMLAAIYKVAYSLYADLDEAGERHLAVEIINRVRL